MSSFTFTQENVDFILAGLQDRFPYFEFVWERNDERLVPMNITFYMENKSVFLGSLGIHESPVRVEGCCPNVNILNKETVLLYLQHTIIKKSGIAAICNAMDTQIIMKELRRTNQRIDDLYTILSSLPGSRDYDEAEARFENGKKLM
nr:hypothetical protein K-LCC10_0191 [Kaumoebavirus]